MKIFKIEDYLQTPEDKAGYLLAALEESLEESNWETLLMAINDVAEVEGIDFVAERAQMSPEEIGHALQAIQSPASKSILRLLKALKLNFNTLHDHTAPAG